METRKGIEMDKNVEKSLQWVSENVTNLGKRIGEIKDPESLKRLARALEIDAEIVRIIASKSE